ncbi:Non ATPase subunit MPR1 of 26S proteasome [Giardia muris]|uniref:Non ATPase subunit MPR1 of 26S proteasome n=1 Tax=Giardia muris TaxID=5742 RepID=A0A4Z1T7A8_GIAMU|nr:Non ATPase subunit MPR1 of 26S proteasome [Giardia muris]|eukprot:TNJ29963.1 Non ATPase subunit MPR1 of 26S proteasome [Giardia muris]
MRQFPFGDGIPGLANTRPTPRLDHGESVIVSHVALIKMLRHCKQGIPVEVMGLLLGTFVDKYTVYVSDCFSMPQIGQADSVDSVDEVFQAEMLELLKQVHIPENCVGWYHSHPGYYAWLSQVDQNTHKIFEKLDNRSIAIVVDPMNSCAGKLVIEAFRLLDGIGPGVAFGLQFGPPSDNRIVTSDKGFLRPKNPTSLLRGLDKQFYAMPMSFTTLGYEQVMLSKMASKDWVSSLCGVGLTIDEDQKTKLEQQEDAEAVRADDIPEDFHLYGGTTTIEILKQLQAAIKLACNSKVYKPCSVTANALHDHCIAEDFSVSIYASILP